MIEHYPPGPNPQPPLPPSEDEPGEPLPTPPIGTPIPTMSGLLMDAHMIAQTLEYVRLDAQLCATYRMALLMLVERLHGMAEDEYRKGVIYG